MFVSFKGWLSDSSEQSRITKGKIYERSLAGPDGNGFFARAANPQKFTGEGQYLDQLNNPGHYTGEAQYLRQIADPYIIQPKKSNSWFA